MASLVIKADTKNWHMKYLDESGVWKSKSLGLVRDLGDNNKKARTLCAEQTLHEMKRSRAVGRPEWDLWVPNLIRHWHREGSRKKNRYLSAWANVMAFLNFCEIATPAALKREHVMDYIDWRVSRQLKNLRRAKHNTAVYELKLLKRVVHEAMKRKYLEEDPFDGIKIRKVAPEEKPPFSDEQIQQIREALKTRPEWMSFAFEIAIHHGVRLRETATDTKNVNLKRNTIHFNYQKNGDPFTVKIAPGVRPLMEKLVAQGGKRLFEIPENDSKPFSNLFEELGMAKENYCFHCTRVTVITRLALADVPIAKAMRYVNHASEEIHRVYTKIKAEDVDGCSEALAIPEAVNP